MPGDRPRRSRPAVRPIRWIGRGIKVTARSCWRVVRRRRRNGGAPMASISASLIEAPCSSFSEEISDWQYHPDEPLFQLPSLPNMQMQLQSLLSAFMPSLNMAAAARSSGSNNTAVAAPVNFAAVPPSFHTGSSSAVSSRSNSSSSRLQASYQQQQHAATAALSSSSSSAVQLLGEMLNPKSTFPMLLHTIDSVNNSSSGSVEAASSNSSSSSSRPQQLLTVGCRNWSNWLLGNGLLKVKIYDFAIYVDGLQAEKVLPPVTGNSSSKQQQQRNSDSSPALQGLPDMLKSRNSGVGMSVILRAARDIPLHMLSEEYEKVLTRRLARAGGDHADSIALQQLIKSFSTPERLPAAVRSCKTSSNVAAAAADGDDGSSVAKGAMLVFERSADGTVTARVGGHVLGIVHSPKLSEALFDLYLGDQPVSKTAKDAAAQTLRRIGQSSSSSGAVVDQQPYYVPHGKHEQIKCEGLGGAQGLGRKGLPTGSSGLGLGLSDLAACVLHME